jgi:H+/gluconate symporter-like permease
VLKKIKVDINSFLFEDTNSNKHNPPSAIASFSIALLPIILITLSVLAQAVLDKNGLLNKVLSFTGDSTIALLIAVIAAIHFFGMQKNRFQIEDSQTNQNEGIAILNI